MKILNVLVFLLLSSFLITSCQKELDFGNFESAGSLKSDTASFDCLPSSVHGTYSVNSPLTDTNYIEVQVNATLSGNYTIQSDTSNGYSFKGTGNFSGTGLNTVRLYGTGMPLLPGTNSFIIHYNTSTDSSFCIIDVEVLTSPGANAEYTFGGAGGTCTGGGIGGTYMAGLATSSSNVDTVSVNVTVVGNYSITTTTVNGINFLATGVFTTLGTQTVILNATGTPLTAGPSTFSVSGGTSTGCAFTVTVVPTAPPATFTLGGTPGNCTGVVLNGTYAATAPVNISNSAVIDVNVTIVGSYTISTSTANGITFTASGIFMATGPQSVTLVPTGTPVVAGPFDFSVTGGSSTCTFTVPFVPAVTDFISCNIDGVFSAFNAGAAAILDVSGGSPILTISGQTVTGSDPSISLRISSTAASIPVGTYTTGQLAAGIYLTCNYYDVSNTDFFAESNVANQSANPPVFTIIINNITATRVIGTFSGTGGDNDGAGPNFRAITNGVFDVPIQ